MVNGTVTVTGTFTVGQILGNATGAVWTVAASGAQRSILDNTGGPNNLFGNADASVGVGTGIAGANALQVNANLIIANTSLDVGTLDGGLTLGAAANGASITASTAQTLFFRDNSSANAAVIVNDSIGLSGSTLTLSNAGTSTGGVTLAGTIGASVTSITQNSTTSLLTLGGNNTAFAGAVNITADTVNINQGNSNDNLGTGTVTLGNATGSANAAIFFGQAGPTVTYTNAIATTGTAGTLSITNGSGALTFTGPVTLGNNLTLNDNNGQNGVFTFTGVIGGTGNLIDARAMGNAGFVTLSGTVNNTGSLINQSTNAGATLKVTGVLGSGLCERGSEQRGGDGPLRQQRRIHRNEYCYLRRSAG